MDRPLLAAMKQLADALQPHGSLKTRGRVVTLVRRLLGLAVNGRVILLRQPGCRAPVDVSQREQSGGANLGFQLALQGLEEPLDQAARRRVARRPMQQLDVQLRAGQLQRVGVIDLGVVDIEFAAGAMMRPGAEQRVDQDVEVLAEVVSGFHDIAAVAVDPGGETRLARHVPDAARAVHARSRRPTTHRPGRVSSGSEPSAG